MPKYNSTTIIQEGSYLRRKRNVAIYKEDEDGCEVVSHYEDQVWRHDYTKYVEHHNNLTIGRAKRVARNHRFRWPSGRTMRYGMGYRKLKFKGYRAILNYAPKLLPRTHNGREVRNTLTIQWYVDKVPVLIERERLED